MRTLRRIAIVFGFAWLYTFLFQTPRGEELLEHVARALFPDWTQRRSTDKPRD